MDIVLKLNHNSSGPIFIFNNLWTIFLVGKKKKTIIYKVMNEQHKKLTLTQNAEIEMNLVDVNFYFSIFSPYPIPCTYHTVICKTFSL